MDTSKDNKSVEPSTHMDLQPIVRQESSFMTAEPPLGRITSDGRSDVPSIPFSRSYTRSPIVIEGIRRSPSPRSSPVPRSRSQSPAHIQVLQNTTSGNNVPRSFASLPAKPPRPPKNNLHASHQSRDFVDTQVEQEGPKPSQEFLRSFGRRVNSLPEMNNKSVTSAVRETPSDESRKMVASGVFGSSGDERRKSSSMPIQRPVDTHVFSSSSVARSAPPERGYMKSFDAVEARQFDRSVDLKISKSSHKISSDPRVKDSVHSSSRTPYVKPEHTGSFVTRMNQQPDPPYPESIERYPPVVDHENPHHAIDFHDHNPPDPAVSRASRASVRRPSIDNIRRNMQHFNLIPREGSVVINPLDHSPTQRNVKYNFSEPQNQRLTDPKILDDIKAKWKNVVEPCWQTTSLVSNYAKLDDFLNLIKYTYLYPHEFDKIDITHAFTRFYMFPQDVVAAKLAIALHRSRMTTPLTLYPNNEAGGNSEGDLSLFYADTVFTDRGMNSISRNLLKTHGPDAVLKSESSIHAAAIIAPSLMITSFIGRYIDYVHNPVDNFGDNKQLFTIITSLQTVSIFLLLFSILHSTVQIFFCSVASIDDKLSASYLSIPMSIRFLDIFLFFFVFSTTFPASIIAITFKEPEYNGNFVSIFMIVIVAMFIFATIITKIYSFARVYYSSLKDIHGKVTCPEEIQARPTEKVPGLFSRLLESVFFTNHVLYNDSLSAIGLYRKRELGKKAREAALNRIVERVIDDDVKKI